MPTGWLGQTTALPWLGVWDGASAEIDTVASEARAPGGNTTLAPDAIRAAPPPAGTTDETEPTVAVVTLSGASNGAQREPTRMLSGSVASRVCALVRKSVWEIVPRRVAVMRFDLTRVLLVAHVPCRSVTK